MPFTDDEIKRLKEMMSIRTTFPLTLHGPQIFEALLHRLEAAEEALTATCECEPVDHPNKCAETIAWNKWCKAAGR